jgi:hypothetical protein
MRRQHLALVQAEAVHVDDRAVARAFEARHLGLGAPVELGDQPVVHDENVVGIGANALPRHRRGEARQRFEATLAAGTPAGAVWPWACPWARPPVWTRKGVATDAASRARRGVRTSVP